MHPKLLPLLAVLAVSPNGPSPAPPRSAPNVIFILADDLGYGDVGFTGQRLIKTPNLDALAREGMRCTQAYAGTSVCAPSRSALMTGRHTGHTYVRGNFGPNQTRVSFPDSIFTMAELFKARGYATGLFGKWGLGAKNTAGTPNRQGFDVFAGYLDQAHAHEYYPEKADLNETEVLFPENRGGKKGTYSADWYFGQLLDFVKKNRDRPFFAYFATTLPHAKYQLAIRPEYAGQAWSEGQKIYASMVTHLDEQVGELRRLLRQQGLDNNTLLVFTSDNGPGWQPHGEPGNPAFDPALFNSSGGLRGIKRDLYEGGMREPMAVYWKNRIRAGSQTDFPLAFWDFMPTFAELTGYDRSLATDGVSLLPLWLGKGQPRREYLYWEFHLEGAKQGMKQALRRGDWKLVRNDPERPFELYDLRHDPNETTDLAPRFPEKVRELTALMAKARTESAFWPTGR